MFNIRNCSSSSAFRQYYSVCQDKKLVEKMTCKSSNQKSNSSHATGTRTVKAGASTSTNRPPCHYRNPILKLEAHNESKHGQAPIEVQ